MCFVCKAVQKCFVGIAFELFPPRVLSLLSKAWKDGYEEAVLWKGRKNFIQQFCHLVSKGVGNTEQILRWTEPSRKKGGEAKSVGLCSQCLGKADPEPEPCPINHWASDIWNAAGFNCNILKKFWPSFRKKFSRQISRARGQFGGGGGVRSREKKEEKNDISMQ